MAGSALLPVGRDYRHLSDLAGVEGITAITVNGHAILSGHEHVWTDLEWTTRSGEAMRHEYRSPEALGNTRYTDAFQHFFQCMRTGQQPDTGADAGVTAVAMAMAVYESARTGRKVDLDR